MKAGDGPTDSLHELQEFTAGVMRSDNPMSRSATSRGSRNSAKVASFIARRLHVAFTYVIFLEGRVLDLTLWCVCSRPAD